MKLVNEIEHRFPVEQWIVRGIHVWPLVRINLTTELHFEGARPQPPLSLYGALQAKALYATRRFSTYYRLMVADRERNEDPNAQAEVALLAGSITRQLRTPWGWFATLPDALREELRWHGARMVFLETAGPVEYRTPRYSPSMPVDLDLFLGLIRAKAELALASEKTLAVMHRLPGFSELQKGLTRAGIRARSASAERVLFMIRLIEVYSEIYRSVLRRTKPKVCLVVSYSTLEGMAFCASCRQLGIPCYDIQHGLAGELHRAYGRWRRVPPQGYNLLPTGFWCWSRQDADAINAWNDQLAAPHDVLVGGNLWEKYWRSEHPSKVRQTFGQGLNKLGERTPGELRVLYTMQGPDLPELLLEAIGRSPKHLRWLIRLHPNSIRHEHRIAARFEGRSNVEVHLATALPLYLLLQDMDVHVTQWSAVVRDASSCSVPSVVIDPIGEDVFSAEIDAGHCAVRYDVGGLLEAIERYGQRPPPDQPTPNKASGLRKLLEIIGA